MDQFKKIVAAILVIILIVFLIQNSSMLFKNETIKFISWEVDIAVFLIILISAIVGFLLGYGYKYLHVSRLIKEIRGKDSEINNLKSEVNNLRNIPVEEDDKTQGEK